MTLEAEHVQDPSIAPVDHQPASQTPPVWRGLPVQMQLPPHTGPVKVGVLLPHTLDDGKTRWVLHHALQGSELCTDKPLHANQSSNRNDDSCAYLSGNRALTYLLSYGCKAPLHYQDWVNYTDTLHSGDNEQGRFCPRFKLL